MLRGVCAVLLDLDGTLVDRDAALRAWLSRRAGLGHELDRLLALDRADGGELAALALELHRLRPGLAVSPRALLERVRGELPSFIRPDPAIGRALARLRQAKFRLALVSNGGPTQRQKLAAAQLPESLFATIQVSGEIGVAKPAAAIFQAALRALAVSPEQTVMIGDSPREDIAGAAALGIASCWIAHGREWPAEYAEPDHIARDLPSAVELLLSNQGKSKSSVSASRTSEK
jgi:putative hydrolase of the HAD superfamily